MKNTEAESANLKRRLRTLRLSSNLEREAKTFPLEADEAVEEVKRGFVSAIAGSYVAVILAEEVPA